MNTKYILLALATGSVLTACKQGKEQKIEALKTEIKNQKGKLADLKTAIKTLEDSLAHLEPKKEELTMVSVVPVAPGAFSHYLDIQAKVESDNNVLVSAQMPGKVIKLTVKDGDRVSKGQVIAYIDAESVSKGLEELKNQYDLAKTVYEKQKTLWEQKIGTEIQYLQAKTNKEALEKKMESINVQLDMAKVKAPIAGIVEQTMVKEGEMAMGPVARIVNGSDFKVVADVAETYTSSINQGDAITIEFPDLHKTIKTRITKVGSIINPVSRTFNVESRIGNIVGLKPNMMAKVQLQDYAKGKTITIPVNLVQNDVNGKFVFVEKNGVAVKMPVTIGLSYGNTVEIIDGLQIGDKVITVGYLELVANQKIVVK